MRDKEEVIRERMSRLSTSELRRIINEESEHYEEYALEIARQELQKRPDFDLNIDVQNKSIDFQCNDIKDNQESKESLAELKLNIQEWADDELLIAIGNGRSNYSKKAIQIIANEIQERGIETEYLNVRNFSRRNAIEEKIMYWIKVNNQMVISGHTHHASFAKPGEVAFFNDGCCVKSNHITGIEIKNGEIALVKWSRKLGNDKSTLITRDIIAGPEKIIDFFPKNSP